MLEPGLRIAVWACSDLVLFREPILERLVIRHTKSRSSEIDLLQIPQSREAKR